MLSRYQQTGLTAANSKIGLVLSGGGARAAYQIGVLRAVANILPRDTTLPFQIIAGTSAGALNAVPLACYAHNFRTAMRALEYIWTNIESSQIYLPNSGAIIANASSLILSIFSNKISDAPSALLNNEPLTKLLNRVIKFQRIQKNIDIGLLDAVSITASSYSSGESVSFFQAIKGLENWQGPHRIGVRTELTLDHLLASTAIPVMFPAVKIGSQYYSDGAIRQLAPTSTALHLGAKKILVVGVSANGSDRPEINKLDSQPSLATIVGHLLNSAFVDNLENDLEVLRKINRLTSLVAPRLRRKQGLPEMEVELLEISPSKELHLLALDYHDELPRHMKRFIKKTGSGIVLSLLLFEKGYCNALCQLGYKDAMEKEQQIRDFFTPED